MSDETILVELWNSDDDAFAATASTIRLLGGELSRPEPGDREGFCLVRPVSAAASFLRWSLVRQGYVKHVVE